MDDMFVTSISINNVRNITDYTIPLSTSERKNLIITGRNGSGKTSFLEEVRKYLRKVSGGDLDVMHQQLNHKTSLEDAINRSKDDALIQNYKNNLENINVWFRAFGGTKIEFKNPNKIGASFKEGNFIIAYFDAKRNSKFKEPTGIQKVNFRDRYNVEENIGVEFIQYIVNLRADKSFAREEGEHQAAEDIGKWFDNFEKSLAELFENTEIKLQFDRKKYNFNIIEPNKAPYTLNQLSDGYSAILSIITELILRIDSAASNSYKTQGIVLIDEIETHLHVELQKKILPFLTSFFPKIQFIITTHSPFVLSSIENAIICDLEKKIVTDDLSGYSYDALIESYFDIDKYSAVLKKKVDEFENLSNKEQLNDEEREKYSVLEKYLNELPKFYADELAVKMQQIKLKQLNRKD